LIEERAISNKASFRAEAAFQRCCQNPACKKPSAAWHPHHVIYEQELRGRGLPLYDTRNALRLCIRCHGDHHGIRPVPLTCLRDCNIAYAFKVLGGSASYYLKRHYAGEDPRIDEHERTLNDEQSAA
jgi:hypothetical protein